jgi:hypothetical protein
MIRRHGRLMQHFDPSWSCLRARASSFSALTFRFAMVLEKAAVGKSEKRRKGAGQNEWWSNREGRWVEEGNDGGGENTGRHPYEDGRRGSYIFQVPVY